MSTLTTNGIRISVAPAYHKEHSNPAKHKFVFSYEIKIENKSPHTVQLMRRHWFIFDSSGRFHEVEGEGVVGETPILEPGQSHEYLSWCPLVTPLGKMHGAYLMERTSDKSSFEVAIPEFHLVVPALLN